MGAVWLRQLLLRTPYTRLTFFLLLCNLAKSAGPNGRPPPVLLQRALKGLFQPWKGMTLPLSAPHQSACDVRYDTRGRDAGELGTKTLRHTLTPEYSVHTLRTRHSAGRVLRVVGRLHWEERTLSGSPARGGTTFYATIDRVGAEARSSLSWPSYCAGCGMWDRRS